MRALREVIPALLDQLDRLLHKHSYYKFFCCFVASVDSFLGVICHHVPTVLLLLVLFWRQNQTATNVGTPSGTARSSANAVAL